MARSICWRDSAATRLAHGAIALAVLVGGAAAEVKPVPDPAEIAAPDPLTPPKADESPLRAPSAAAAPVAPAAAPASEAHPAIAELTRIISASPGANAAQREDRAAMIAFYSEGNRQPIWTMSNGYAPHAQTAIGELRRAGELGLEPRAFEVAADPGPFASPTAQAEAEIAIGQAVLLYARHARGSRVDPGAISKMIDMRPRLFEPKSVLEAMAATTDAAAGLRLLHPQHPGFQRLAAALVSARQSGANADVIQRIIINLERWRWMPDDLGAFYVHDNVPEQYTRVYKNGEPVLQEKIVVGKPNTPTPMFSANMQFVIFHPSWGVPEGIKTNELAPLLRRYGGESGFLGFGGGDGASRVLARHKLVVTQNGRPVNPDSVNWSSVNVRNYSFTQPPSGDNVLGIVKFRFPNRFDVYMHDTPERHLFNGGQRAFSHGCMRVQNPMHLAEVILAHDKGWSAEKVQGFVRQGGTSEITLSTQVPVHITYFTATADEKGKLNQHPDIYGMDSRVASALAGKAVAVAAVKGEPGADVVTGSTERPARRAIRTKKGGEPPAAFNPFSGLFGN